MSLNWPLLVCVAIAVSCGTSESCWAVFGGADLISLPSAVKPLAPSFAGAIITADSRRCATCSARSASRPLLAAWTWCVQVPLNNHNDTCNETSEDTAVMTLFFWGQVNPLKLHTTLKKSHFCCCGFLFFCFSKSTFSCKCVWSGSLHREGRV